MGVCAGSLSSAVVSCHFVASGGGGSDWAGLSDPNCGVGRVCWKGGGLWKDGCRRLALGGRLYLRPGCLEGVGGGWNGRAGSVEGSACGLEGEMFGDIFAMGWFGRCVSES